MGCVEPQRPSPFAGMSEEQKEYEAMKLVNLINDLSNVGIVKPALPGPGKEQQEGEKKSRASKKKITVDLYGRVIEVTFNCFCFDDFRKH